MDIKQTNFSNDILGNFTTQTIISLLKEVTYTKLVKTFKHLK